MTATMRSSPAQAAIPPNLRTLHQYSPDWARTAATTTNLGLLYRGELHGFTVDASAFRSIFDIDNADITLISSDAQGNATATTLRTPSATRRSRIPAKSGWGARSIRAISKTTSRCRCAAGAPPPSSPPASPFRWALSTSPPAIRLTCRNAHGRARAAKTTSSNTPPRRAMPWPGAIVFSCASRRTGRATTRRCARPPGSRASASARRRTTTSPPSSI